MTSQFPTVGLEEQRALIGLCLLAAFADGNVNELERGEIKRAAERLSGDGLDLTPLYQQAFSGKLSIETVANSLRSRESKGLAYEMACCICEVDQALNEAEKKFLAELQGSLGYDAAASSEFERDASQLRDQPPVIGTVAPPAANNLDELIRDRAVLAGALEILPNRLATMAIVPAQMQMVYQIGKAYGYDLDLSHAKEFFATVGVGVTSQVIEGYLSKLVGGMSRHVLGRFVGALASQATESAIAFATTYAVGQVAKTYYSGGRKISTPQLRDLFATMLSEGRSMQARYGGEIAQRANSLRVADFLPLAKK